MKKAALAVAALCAVLGWGGPLRAEDEAPGPCKADVEKLCKDVQPGEGRVMKCMKDHEADLSQECKDRIAAGKEKMRERMKARRQKAADDCKADKEKFCKDVKPGGGAIIDCLNGHAADLSEACRRHVAQAAKRQAAAAACKPDVEKLCKDEKSGGGRIIKCLNQHADKLSDACKKALEEAKARRAEMKERMSRLVKACKADKEKFCADMKPGGGGIMKCLKGHMDELSDDCKAAWPGHGEMKKAPEPSDEAAPKSDAPPGDQGDAGSGN